jgi:hypothetical protein
MEANQMWRRLVGTILLAFLMQVGQAAEQDARGAFDFNSLP